MNKNKKLIALICAISMIFSVFAGFTVVNAAGDDGVVITNIKNDSEDGKTLTMDIKLTGYADGVSGLALYVQMPDSITDVGTTTSLTGWDGGLNTESHIYTFSWTQANGENQQVSDVASLVLTASAPISADTPIKFTNNGILKTSVSHNDPTTGAPQSDKLGNGLSEGDVAIPAWVDPNKKPTTTTTPVPVAEDPKSEQPELDPVVTVGEKGIELANLVENDDGTVSFDINLKGYDDGVSGLAIYIQMPDAITDVGTTTSLTGWDGGLNTESHIYTFSWTQANGENQAVTKAATLTLTRDTDKSQYITQAVLTNNGILKTSVSHNDPTTGAPQSDKLGSGLNAVNVNIPAYSDVKENTKVGEIALNKAVTVDVTDTPDSNGESEYFIIPTVKKGNDDAEYGVDKDYVATIGDTVLTPAQYSNLINGHLDADNVKDIVAANNIKDINDVVDAIKFRIYDKSVTVAAQIVNKTTSEIYNKDDTAQSTTTKTDEDKPSTPKAPAWSGISPKTVEGGDTVVITAKLAKNDYKDGSFVVSVDNLAPVSGAGIRVLAKNVIDTTVQTQAATASKKTDNDEELTLAGATKSVEFEDNNDNDTVTIEVSFVAVAAKTAQTMTLTYAYVDENGDAIVSKTASVKDQLITIKKQSSDNGGSSSSSSSGTSSGGNVIAAGNQGSLNTGAGIGIGFTDLDQAPWASTAITMLSANHIVSGVGDNKFDPNGDLTRAAYAQMLVNAIGHSQDSADTYFNDVPTDAWYYHNVAVAAQLGIVSGYGDGNFGPYDLITREQMALMTQKAAQVMNVSLNATTSQNFTDDADIADWSKAAVYELANAGIINGMGDGTFAPKANATRAQAAVIIYNTFVAK